MNERVFNFSAGPATLPLPVLEQARDEMLALPGAGASVLEISHRSSTFREIVEEARANIVSLLGLPDSYHVLFLPGGATLQFSMVPMNLMRGADTPRADYVLTGSWGRKAVKEARREGEVRIPWDGAPDFNAAPGPSEIEFEPGAAYVHVTSNETIEGVQMREVPDTGDTPLVCDASSEIFSRPITVDRYALVYAGAQKNAGPSGVTIVILRDDLLERIPEDLPTMLDYRAWVKAESLLNTPCTFSVYVLNLVMRWIRDEVGDLAGMHERNREKARRLYEAIDQSDGFYRGHAAPAARSLMNVTFRLASEDLEADFLAEAQARGLHGLKGHRSVGGCRASIYNAMSLEGVDELRRHMDEFRAARG